MPGEDPASSSSDEEEDEGQKALMVKVEAALEEYHLSPFAMVAAKKWVRLMADRDNTHLDRVREWLLLKINSRSRGSPPTKWQQQCPEIVPGLRASPVWNHGSEPSLAWVRELQDNFAVIKEELLQLRHGKGFQPFRQPSWSTKIPAADQVGSVSHDAGDWNVFYLFLHNERFEDNCARCPKTVEIIERIVPRQYKHAFFSALNPGTHVVAHTGPTNKKLRCHMPLLGVEGSRLRVGDIVEEQQEGKCYVFDDSFEHEAWHDGSETRVVLLFDLWHPDFSDEEVKFFDYLQKSKLKAEKQMSAGDDTDNNFFSLLRKTRNMLNDNSWWVSKDEDGGGEAIGNESGAAGGEASGQRTKAVGQGSTAGGADGGGVQREK